MNGSTRVIFMAGLTRQKSKEEQTILFKEGFGEGEIKSFNHNQFSKVRKELQLNPDALLVLYSKSAENMVKASKTLSQINKLYIIEPYVSPNAQKQFQQIQEMGFLSKNTYVGSVGTRGKGINELGTGPNGNIGIVSNTPSNLDHFEALIYAGKQIKTSNLLPTEEQAKEEKKLNESDIKTTNENGDVLSGVMEKYIVKRGDYLYKIARMFPIEGISSKERVQQIYEANPFLKGRRIKTPKAYHGGGFLENEDLLFPGDELMITGYGDPLKQFDCTGIVVDSTTNQPIEGANIKTTINDPGKSQDTTTDKDGRFAVNGVYVPEEQLLRKTIKKGSKGKLVEQLQEKLAIGVDGIFGIKTEESVKKFQENNNLESDGIVGSITWSVIDNIGNKNKTYLFDILISKPTYTQKKISPFNLDKSIKDSLGIIPLEPIKASTKIAELEEQLMDNEILENVKALKISTNPGGFASLKMGNLLIDRIKESLIPQILQLIAQFGIGKVQEALGKPINELQASCPPDLDSLNKIIITKNKLTRILNQIIKTLENIKIGVDVTDQAVTALNITLPIISNVFSFFPVAGFGVPDVSKFLSVPNGPLDKINTFLKKLKVVTSGMLLLLTTLITLLTRTLQYLALLDALIQKCFIEGAIPSVEVDPTLFPVEDRKSDSSSLIVRDASNNEFILDIEVEKNTSEIKRKRAIAKNKANVIMLRGEWSFSSNDQILMNELKFYIQQNDLKAD